MTEDNIEEYRVETPHFVAWLSVKEGRVYDTAPILRWSRNIHWSTLKEKLRRKFGKDQVKIMRM